MTFTTPIGATEGRQIIGWHVLGLSPRDMRDLMAEEDYRFPVRSNDGIRLFLRRHDYEPHPSQRGPKVDGRDTHCDRHDEPVERRGKNNECPVCKRAAAVERRKRVRVGLTERVESLRAMGGEAAEIADWIDEHVRVA